ncbi:MAG: hypothetical protein KGH94_03955 [Candidatus Micrarchaeota archaeon]|nr:hypothetical protein [Candidatus Micrarchaeota archaeon]
MVRKKALKKRIRSLSERVGVLEERADTARELKVAALRRGIAEEDERSKSTNGPRYKMIVSRIFVALGQLEQEGGLGVRIDATDRIRLEALQRKVIGTSELTGKEVGDSISILEKYDKASAKVLREQLAKEELLAV